MAKQQKSQRSKNVDIKKRLDNQRQSVKERRESLVSRMQSDRTPQNMKNISGSESKEIILTPKTQKYFSKLLHINGKHLFNFQTSHLMVMYFIIQGLAVSDSLTNLDKNTILNYIKTLQLQNGGFAPSSLYTGYHRSHQFDIPHLVFTYSAINVFKILGALNQVNTEKCLNSVRFCFKENGSFSNFLNSNEADLRFVYAALAICNALEDFSILDNNKVKNYIDSCFNYDGGYGLRPYCESHCGAVYCAVASYRLMGYEIPNVNETLEFLVNRQSVNSNNNITGVQGRVGKLPDSCYTFWVGASVKILTGENLLNETIAEFLKLCYNEETFNFSKYPNTKGDPLHTLHSIVGLKILNKNDEDIDIIQGVTHAK